jgi:hypothetical protein
MCGSLLQLQFIDTQRRQLKQCLCGIDNGGYCFAGNVCLPFLQAQFFKLEVLEITEPCLLKAELSAVQRAAIDCQDIRSGFGCFHNAADTAAYACQAEHLADAFFCQLPGRLVGDCAHIGRTGTGKDEFRPAFT